MIEEAAGTRMYESKKQSAQRTIEKKDSKLQEIETVSLEKLVTYFYMYYLKPVQDIYVGVSGKANVECHFSKVFKLLFILFLCFPIISDSYRRDNSYSC